MELAEKYKPVVFLHSDEEYFPCPIQDYIESAELVTSNGTKSPLTPEKIGIEYADMKDSVLRIPPEKYRSDVLSMMRTPFYVSTGIEDGYIRITYWFFYPYSGPLYICCPRTSCQSVPVGQHQSDFEHVTMYFDQSTYEFIKMYYSAHRNVDGVWVQAKDVEFIEHDNVLRPVVYSALSTHGSYPQGKCYARICGFGSDVTNQGYAWCPHLEFIDENTVWNKYSGAIGYPDHGRMPLFKSSWRTEPRKSTNAFKRFFCCLCDV